MKASDHFFSEDPSQQSAGTLQQLTLLADLSQDFVKSMNINDILRRAVTRIKTYMTASSTIGCAGPVPVQWMSPRWPSKLIQASSAAPSPLGKVR